MVKKLLLLNFFCLSHIAFTQVPSDSLKVILENGVEAGNLNLFGQKIHHLSSLYRFYSQNQFQSIWHEGGRINQLAYELIEQIGDSKYDGLDPKTYHQEILEQWVEPAINRKLASEFALHPQLEVELLLSDALMALGHDLRLGRVNPATLDIDWYLDSDGLGFVPEDFLAQTVREKKVKPALSKLYPKVGGYVHGRELLREMYQKIQEEDSDWTLLEAPKSIKLGEHHSVISIIRQRLAYWGLYKIDSLAQGELYDSTLFEAVKNFQQIQGLAVDGVLGKNTLASLSHSASDVKDKIVANMERFRWLNAHLNDPRYIFVNIPDFSLTYFDEGDTLFSSRVVVGTTKNRTPSFKSELTYMVFSPFWNIPTSIIRNEIIPAMRKKPDYISSKNMEVITYSGSPVNPAEVDWSANSIPYLVRQKPGPRNSLGLVKFMFPNKYSIYIHDTPSKYLFHREKRAFSHGCVRLEKPREFASLLLEDKPDWDEEAIVEAMSQGKEKTVYLEKKLPVYLVYLTFWADEKGRAFYRPDIYDYDKVIAGSL